ncbi:beta-ketoacyl synthase N-terminal-like domain-containing protein [Nodularia harveyana UHCC-0300]|uniref:Beta-ketoacyl synthase N-terminal-like domain-containing protein n=1 Tax=Nodularia harveyana UHCC-0300 TaxID=2974287 RepID=A0ABU5UAX6_9CYAN|nr:polyketide synthase [Nodularia harveyana]MEA5580675.1 beta-ketoacyl synthase N-terminal-like domain-containing protein [Nodularia harveyana UHCC-0300]
MSAYSIDTALAELESLIKSVEKTLIGSIEEKKLHKETPMSINKINRKLQQNPIAIVGMASLLPQARNLQQYWQNIVNKIDCITDVPDSHWSVKDYYDPNPRTSEDKTYCKRGGFIPEIDFNPMEFGIPPSILEVTDISQLLSLVIAKEAMEDAGYGESSEFSRENVGVILGVAMAKQLGMPLSARLEYPVWEKALKSSGLSDEDTQKIIEKIKSAYIKWDENAFPGMLANVVAGRIANRLNFGGTNCVVDAACASSFGALKMAISELVEYRADMMLTGGVDTDNTIMAYISFSKTPAVSPSGNTKPFDATSDGMLLGEGVCMYVLKRLEDAERDNDKIYAVIKGIGTSSDGRYKSIYAPRKEGQVKALERAYDDAGFSPATVGLIEAHGTGTMAGDPIEFGSIKDYFSQHDSQKQHIALGSVKSQIGHTKAAAGAASLIKTALALHHKVLPPTINITEPNPKLDIKNSSFYLNTQTRPWIKAEGEAPRRAGVSSFGFGGTNYHVVLEEYETAENLPYRLHGTAREVLLFANNPAELLSKCEETLNKLQADGGERHFAALLKECQSVEIPQVAARVGFVAENLPEACKLMQVCIDWLKHKASVPAWEHPQGIYYRSSGMELGGKIVSLFSGQGSQYLEMGRDVVMNFPIMRRLHGCMDSLLLKDNLQPVSEIVFPRPVFDEGEKNAQVAALQRTEYAQPAIGVFSAGLYSIFQQAGFKSDFVAGHSFGELTALWAAGVLSEEDYLFLVKSRGQAMAAPEDPDHDAGSMLAVKEEMSKVTVVLRNFPQVTVANFNSPTQIVLAGPTAEIMKVRQALQEQGCTAVVLPVSAAFHTPLIAFAQKSFAIATKSVKFNQPQIPVFTNVTGKTYPQEPQGIQKILETHLASSVMFKQEIENIYAAGGYCFVEFGPRRILTNLVKDILGDRPHLTISLNPSTQKNSDRTLKEAAVQLRVVGVPLQNLDPYQFEPALPPVKQKKALNVRLKGINYVSEKTKNAFTEALQNGHQVTLPAAPVVTSTPEFSEIVTPTAPAKEHTTNGRVPHPIDSLPEFSHNSTNSAPQPETVQEKKMQPTPEKPVTYQRALESLENLLTQFQQNQTDNLQVHGTYLQHQMEYTKAFFQLMQEQNTIFANSKTQAEAAQLQLVVKESIERGMMQFHSQQGETLRIHEQYLLEQLEYAKKFFQLIKQEYSQVISTQVTTVAAAPVVAKEPVPAPVVAPEPAPTPVVVPEPAPAPVVAKEPAPVVVPEPAPAPVVAKEPAPTPVVAKEPAPVSTSNLDLSELGNNLLAITSDKTGYPVEMLEMDMDMEADLGIDSIKRVEILGALQDIYPDLPQPNLEELSEKRSIGEVVEYLQSHVSGSSSVETETSTTNQEVVLESTQSPLPLIPIGGNKIPSPVEMTDSVVSTPLPTELEPEIATTDDYADLGQTLLSITSDKTGYPVEMLEMDMDMEADLGIDSIKRVEILGAMQDKYPNLPQPNIEELGDLRTIGQIVDYLQKLAGGEKKKPQQDFSHQSVQVIDGVRRRPAKLQFLPPADSLDFALPEGHVTVITDDGSLTTSQVAQTLSDRGGKVVVLSFPPSVVPQQSLLPAGVNRVVLADMTEELLQHKLSAIATHFGTIGGFIHIHPVFEAHQRPAFISQEKEIVKHVFFMAKHLKQTLNEVARYERSYFLTVNRLDGAFGLDSSTSFRANFGAIGAGLFGLTKSLKWEWPKVFTRAIDLSPTLDAQTSAAYIIAELHDPNLYISEVAYGSQGRVTLVASVE